MAGWTARSIAPWDLAERSVTRAPAASAPITKSAPVAAGGNIPGFVGPAIQDLTNEHALRGDYLSQLLQGVGIRFAQPAYDPMISQSTAIFANAMAARAAQQTAAIQQANQAQVDLANLEKRRSTLGQNPFGLYWGSPQQAADRQIFDAQLNTQPDSALQSLGRAAANGSSGWSPALPHY